MITSEGHFDDRYLHVELEDGRIILIPMSWYKDLQTATFKQLTLSASIPHFKFFKTNTKH